MRRLSLVVVLVIVVGGASTALISRTGPADAQSTDASEPSAPASTTTVEPRDLVEYEEFAGSLGYGTPVAVSAGVDGTVTATPSRGDVISDGGVLFDIDAEPVVLVDGTTPVYRAMTSGVVGGPDVSQLEAFLVRSGYAADLDLTVDEEYTSVTAAAVELWETDIGRAEPDGEVALGELVFASGDARVDSVDAATGSRVSTGTAVIQVTAPTRSVTVDLDTDDVERLPLGATVELELPDGTPSTGTVAAVGVEAEQAEQADETEDTEAAATVPVEISLDDPDATDVDTGTVTVQTISRSESAPAAVEVQALLALAEGGYALEVIDGDSSQLIAVDIGTFADGFVAVSGEGVQPGLIVATP